LISKENENIVCKYCGSPAKTKCGSYKGIPRYLCKSCGRKYKADDHLFYMRASPEYVAEALSSYYNNITLKEIQAEIKDKYGFSAAQSTIYRWIERYTKKLVNITQELKPQVGDTWLVSGITLRIARFHLSIYYVVDEKTKFLISSVLGSKSDYTTARPFIQEAAIIASKLPKVVLVGLPPRYCSELEETFGCEVHHLQRHSDYVDDYRELIDIYREMSESQRDFILSLKHPNTIRRSRLGFNIHYNYFKPQESLNGKTPAEMAIVNCPFHTWQEAVDKIVLD